MMQRLFSSDAPDGLNSVRRRQEEACVKNDKYNFSLPQTGLKSAHTPLQNLAL